ncbi:zinc finger CCCH domain-containing protein 29-like [Herrania umbratica]|uniref:Zinc finger CCCH domain-containing protein 29-like n=1 Tax=Herrania umbratica TaxID=108875 RepID=A0A6J1AT80_9ROSI|nr:zinc finger CCCH domain-containing protein 29-like [Herrania umbratica]
MEIRTQPFSFFSSPDELLIRCLLSDDLSTFIYIVENEGCKIDEEITCGCRQIGSDRRTELKRTPLMLAALSGSFNVLNYILQSGQVDVDKPSSSDGATAFTCAHSAGSPPKIIQALISASKSCSSIPPTANNANTGQNSSQDRNEGTSEHGELNRRFPGQEQNMATNTTTASTSRLTYYIARRLTGDFHGRS